MSLRQQSMPGVATIRRLKRAMWPLKQWRQIKRAIRRSRQIQSKSLRFAKGAASRWTVTAQLAIWIDIVDPT